jgi:hypothetical protein
MSRLDPPAELPQRSQVLLKDIVESAINESMVIEVTPGRRLVFEAGGLVTVASLVAAYPELGKLTSIVGRVVHVSDLLSVCALVVLNGARLREFAFAFAHTTLFLNIIVVHTSRSNAKVPQSITNTRQPDHVQ